jgi:hypothetical protein
MGWYDDFVEELFGSGGGGELDAAMMDAGSTPVSYSPADYGALDNAMMAAGSTPVSYGGSSDTPFYLRPGFLQGAGSALGGLSQAYAGQRAAGTQSDAANRALALQERIYNSMAARNQGAETGGNLARDRYLALVGLGPNTNAMGYGSAVQPFDMSKFQADPGYAFRIAEGQKALDRQAAARGGLMSGGALKAAARYGQDMGSQEYANAYNRYRQNRADQLAPLSDLMTGGTNATNATNTAMGNYGTNAANLMGQAGQATAAGQLGIGNTVNNLAGSLSNQYNTNQMMDILRETRRSAYS